MLMNEAFLQIIWKHKLLGQLNFVGTKGEDIELISIGEHNQDSGPDFFNSKISINTILLAGNVELHVKTSDWNKHNHQNNRAYDNLILHVVYEHDVELRQNEQFNVSVLELKKYIKPELIEQFRKIEESKQTIPCGKSISTVPDIIWKSWLDRLAVSRIESKTEYIEGVFNYSKQNHEDTLYVLLCKSFGFKINNDAFELLAKSLSYSLLKKYSDNSIQIEALLFGVAGFLDELFTEDYPKLLQNEFEFLKHKHQIFSIKKELWRFSKTRPLNFPTVRLAQLTGILTKNQSLYHVLETKPSIKQLRAFFDISTQPYWNSHFQLDSESEEIAKPIGDSAFYSIVINAIVPFLFFYAKHTGKESFVDYALELLIEIPAEVNKKTKEFSQLGITTQNAMESQALIHLYDVFCTKKQCLNCHVGRHLLKKSV